MTEQEARRLRVGDMVVHVEMPTETAEVIAVREDKIVFEWHDGDIDWEPFCCCDYLAPYDGDAPAEPEP